MKWAIIGICATVFLVCVLGIFACALVADVDDPIIASREERNARWLLAGAVISAGVIAWLLTA